MVAKLAGAAETGPDLTADRSGASLHAVVSGDGPPVVLLHGLFGMGSNLGAVARALAPEFRVHQLDLPNHGRSPWQAASDVTSLAEVINEYIRHAIDAPTCVLGHSLGGKVAMQLALSYPQSVAALVVADIAPVEYPASHDAVFEAIEAVALARPESRAAAGEIMREHLRDDGVRQFLLLSLHRNPAGAYVWRFNAEGLREHYAALRAAPIGEPYAGPALFIYGAESDYMTERGKTAAESLFPRSGFYEIAGTGHWLHAEKPEEFNREVRAFLLASRASAGVSP